MRVYVDRNRKHFVGHTLLEMMLSLVLLSIVMASVGSAVMFAAQAIPDDESAVGSMLADSSVLSRMAEDLAMAKYVIEQTSTAVTVVVPDRTGDNLPDRIRYAWSGTKGEPLFFQLNDHAAASLIDAVQAFELRYNTTRPRRQVMGKHSLEGETDLTEYKSDLLASYTSLTSTQWIGQRITPVLNSDNVSFKVSEIELYGHRSDEVEDSLAPAVAIQVQGYDPESGPDNRTYTTGYLEQQNLLGSMEKAIITASRPILLGQEISLIASRDPSNGLSTRLARNTSLGGGLLSSGNAGGNWSNGLLTAMLHKIRVIPTKQGDGYSISRPRLKSISVTLQSGTTDRSALIRQVQMLHAPVLSSPFWEADFSADPTAADLDGDGVMDWSYSSGALPASSLNDDQWTANGTLAAEPMVSYSQMVTADIRMRSETGEGALVYGPNLLYHEEDMKDPYALITQLRQDGRGGQELLFYNDITPTTPIARINDLPQGWIDLRLVLLPGDHLVSIHVNGKEAGTIELEKISQDFPDYTFAIAAAGSDAIFGSVLVQFGGSYTQMSKPAPIGGYALELIE